MVMILQKKHVLICKVALALTVLAISACSNQIRTAEVDINEEELYSLLDDVDASAVSQGAGSSAMSLFSQLLDAEGTLIYFNEGPSASMPIDALFSFVDLGFLDNSLAEYSSFDIDSGRVFLLDGFNGQEREFVLVFEFQLIGEDRARTKAFRAQNVSYKDNRITMEMEGGAYPFRLVSYDLDAKSQEFQNVIQLQVKDQDGLLVGAFTTLVGFEIL